MNRRDFIALASLTAGHVLATPLIPRAGAQPDAPRANLRREKVDDHLDLAIKFLRSQQRADGSINDNDFARLAMTSLSIMAMLSVGHLPTDKTPEGESIRRALTFVLRPENQERNGYFGRRDNSRMYGHGITTLMLAEVAGMGVDDAYDKLVLDRLEKAIDLILKAQAIKKEDLYQGGWRYEPDARDADLSISVWQVMALRSAKNAGLEVPPAAIKSAVTYLKSTYRSRRDGRGEPLDRMSSFTYAPQQQVTYSSATAGMLAMQVCGQYDAPEVKGTVEWLMALRHQLQWGEPWFFYGTYYYAQGMHQRGGKVADHARREVERVLVPQQRNDGSWPPNESTGVYTTALAVLSLSVKYHYLPIYQR
jgi:hypothetical protein